MLNGFRLFLHLELEGRMLVDGIYRQGRHLGSKQWQVEYSEKLLRHRECIVWRT